MVSGLLLGLVLTSPSVKVAVDGPGYLRLVDGGRIVYAQEAVLESKGGWLADAQGALVFPRVAAEPGFSLSSDGWLADEVGRRIGRLALAAFKPEDLPSGNGRYLASSRKAKLAYPGDPSVGNLVVGGTVSKKPESKVEIPTAGAIRIKFRESSDVQNDSFCLGDVAELVGAPSSVAQVELGKSPLPGRVAVLNKPTVLARLQSAGFDAQKWALEMPARVEVRRVAQTVAFSQLVDCATAYGQSKLGPGFEFQPSDSGADVPIQPGTVELRVERFNVSGERATATVGIFVDGKRQNSRSLRLNVTGADGEPIARVAAGASVKLRMWSGGACVEVPARLQTAALVGQSVRVITDLKTTHVGVLSDANTVEVTL